MTNSWILLPEAEEALRQAMRWYDERRAGLGTEFLGVVESALEDIASAPQRWPAWEHTRGTAGSSSDDFRTSSSTKSKERHLNASPSLTHGGSPDTGGLEPHESGRPVRIDDPHGPRSEWSGWLHA